MAEKSNPRVAVSVTGGAAEGGGLVGVQGLLMLLPALSLVLQQPACFACPQQSSSLFEQHSAMHCGRLLSTPNCLGHCLQV